MRPDREGVGYAALSVDFVVRCNTLRMVKTETCVLPGTSGLDRVGTFSFFFFNPTSEMLHAAVVRERFREGKL